MRRKFTRDHFDVACESGKFTPMIIFLWFIWGKFTPMIILMWFMEVGSSLTAAKRFEQSSRKCWVLTSAVAISVNCCTVYRLAPSALAMSVCCHTIYRLAYGAWSTAKPLWPRVPGLERNYVLVVGGNCWKSKTVRFQVVLLGTVIGKIFSLLFPLKEVFSRALVCVCVCVCEHMHVHTRMHVHMCVNRRGESVHVCM